MKKVLSAAFSFLLLAFMFSACKQAGGSKADLQNLDSLLENYSEERARLFPLEATAQGDNRYNDQLPNDGSQSFRDSLKRFYQKYLDELNRYDRGKLDANDQISYDIFKYDMDIKLEGLGLNTWMIPAQQFWGLPIDMGQLGSGTGMQPFKNSSDYENWLGRVKDFSAWTDTAIANFRKGMAAGVVLPRHLVEKMIPQMESMVVTDPTKSLFYGPINKFPKEITPDDQKRLTELYTEAIVKELVPSYNKLAVFLENEYLPKARTSTGISAVPGGDKIYRYFVKYWTTTNKTPEEIYQTGLSEVKRIKAEMEKVREQTGFKGDLKAFFDYLKDDPRRLSPT